MADLKLKNPIGKIASVLDEGKKQATIQEYDEKLEGLAEKIENTIARHGEEYFMVDILKSFLEVSIVMREMMEMMEEFSTVTELFGFAVNFIDDAMESNQQMLLGTMDTKYTLGSRIRASMQRKRAMKNNQRRINAVVKSIYANYGMVTGMTGSFAKLSTSLKKKTSAIGNKNAKRAAKNKGIASAPSAADEYLANRRGTKTSSGTSGTAGANLGGTDDFTSST